jgi:regulator of protease activity HflC (stomatin/prohibitin superfamily)
MSTVKIAKEYERGVVLRLGRLIGLDMGSNQNSTIVFPIPIELLRPLLAAPVPMKAVAAGNGVPASVGRIPGVV